MGALGLFGGWPLWVLLPQVLSSQIFGARVQECKGGREAEANRSCRIAELHNPGLIHPVFLLQLCSAG